MTNRQTLEVLTFDLILEVYELAARMKVREQLSNSGNYAAVNELTEAANASSIRILELSNLIEAAAKTSRGAFGGSVNSLLQQLPLNLGESTRVQLQAFEEALGLPAGATIYDLRTKTNTGIEPSQPGDLWKIAFMVGLATIAAAGIGAPLAAIATEQAIGQKVLEEAIITFGSVVIVETAIAVKKHSTQPKSPTSGERSIEHGEIQEEALPTVDDDGRLPWDDPSADPTPATRNANDLEVPPRAPITAADLDPQPAVGERGGTPKQRREAEAILGGERQRRGPGSR